MQDFQEAQMFKTENNIKRIISIVSRKISLATSGRSIFQIITRSLQIYKEMVWIYKMVITVYSGFGYLVTGR